VIYHSLKIAACSCVSITLPVSSSTRIKASCEWLKKLAYPTAFEIFSRTSPRIFRRTYMVEAFGFERG
jgi:hypothetical protein